MSGITHSHTPSSGMRALAVIAAIVVAFAIAAALAVALGDGGSVAPAPAPAAQDVGSPTVAAPGLRYDGGPEEGSRGAGTNSLPNPGRPDGGPEEGTRGPGH
jgi:hypothetical protein